VRNLVADHGGASSARRRRSPSGALPCCRWGAIVVASVVGLAWACGLQSPATASAANVSFDPSDPGGLVVADVANEINTMTVRAEPGELVFDDARAALTTTAPQCSAVATQEVRCLSGGLGRLTAELGGGDDSFRLDDSVTTVAAIASSSIDGGDGNDSLTSGAGVQSLVGGPGFDLLDAGDGDDFLWGGEGIDSMLGGAGNDSLNSGPGDDRLDAGDGDDFLAGEDGSDLLLGGAGNDSLAGEGGTDSLDGGDGDDFLSGEDGSDLLLGGAGQDVLYGETGDDLVDGGPGKDAVNGGPGTDLLRARDGVPDAVDCGFDTLGRGAGGDLAIVDPVDSVTDCNRIRVDRGLRPRPPFARAARALPESGKVTLRVEGADTFYPLQEVADIPLRSALDTSKGTASVITTKRRGGPVQEASLRGGEFTVHQARTARPFTELRLTAGDFSACRVAGRGSSSSAREVRQLETRIGKRRGKYRVRGRYSIAAAFGTTWVTEDRCDGTLTRVVSGTVHVHDFARNRTVVVHAGHSYLARAR
jgi:hypothetical protein